MAKYDMEEFEKVNPERKGPRLPRWEAEPNYGLPRPRPAAPATGAVAPPAFPGQSGRAALNEGLDGLPIVKPPYGVMSAIDVNKGDLIWQVPHGDTPDAVRNNPRLKGMDIPKTGQPGNVGVLITKTLVIAGDPQPTTMPGRARGAMLRAYDKKTGAQVGEVLLPAPVVGQPMTYSVNGRQYIIVGVSGGNYTGEYISLALPASMTTATAAQR
jgi:quinoprotein glucose dehydrogenase